MTLGRRTFEARPDRYSSLWRTYITEEMLEEARRLLPAVTVNRTKASPVDGIVGILGEMVWALWNTGDWRNHEVGKNKGQADADGVEVKASAIPYDDRLNLLVREDYAEKRKPRAYVQVVINVPKKNPSEILPGWEAVLVGYAFAGEVDVAPLKDFGSKFGGEAGYRCRYIPFRDLHTLPSEPRR